MAELKNNPNQGDVESFIKSVDNDIRRNDSEQLLDIMKEITGKEPQMWGNSMVGFDSYHYKYDSGREGDWFITGFSPRKQALTLYIMSGFSRYDELMAKLGKYKTGKSCLYVKKLDDVDMDVLRDLIQQSTEYMRSKYH